MQTMRRPAVFSFEMSKKKGVMYDLDGTLVSTIELHKRAWELAAKQFQVVLTPQMLIDQNGMRSQDATRMMLPKEKQYLGEEFAKAKAQFVDKDPTKVEMFPFVAETLEKLITRGCLIWICTSARKDFVHRVMKDAQGLELLKEKVVFREMYAEGKPSAEPLLLTLSHMSLKPEEVVYVGDAFSDYGASRNADMSFLYFLPEGREQDPRIPQEIPRLKFHKDILSYIK